MREQKRKMVGGGASAIDGAGDRERTKKEGRGLGFLVENRFMVREERRGKQREKKDPMR